MFAAVLLCFGLLFSACAQDKSIGVIGGADGPTQVYVSNNEGEISEKRPVRMIRLGGTLYYDIGAVSAMTPRCGTMDGQLTKTADAYEVPQQDGGCNFDGAQGYQHATELTKEIPIDGEWVIFKKLYPPKKNIPEYKYCYCLKGTMPNAAGESELMVLANDKDLDFARAAKSFTSANSDDWLDIYAIPLMADRWGITLRAEDLTATGLTVRCEQFGGSPAGELQTGEWFTIERNRGGNWEAVETKTAQEEIAWHSMAYPIAKNDITSWQIDWGWLYGELPPGEYRIGKRIDDIREAGDYDGNVYYAEFTIYN